MRTISSSCCLSVVRRSGMRRASAVAALLVGVLLSGGAVYAQDWTWSDREAAKTWGMHRIAVLQAAGGDIQGAKRTLSQIDEDGPRGPAEVTVVWFCNGVPVYNHRPRSVYGNGCGRGASWSLVANDLLAGRVPLQVPAGLPLNYLAPDARHGAVVEFLDDHDSHGTRVTSRRYADGHTVIETPRSRRN